MSSIEVEHNPSDVLLGFQYIDGEDEYGPIQLFSIGLLFITITIVIQ